VRVRVFVCQTSFLQQIAIISQACLHALGVPDRIFYVSCFFF